MIGNKKSPREQQTVRDVHRAECLVARVRGLSTHEGAEVLRHRASESGISLHAAALAVLSTSPTDEVLLDRSDYPTGRRPDPRDRGRVHHPAVREA